MVRDDVIVAIIEHERFIVREQIASTLLTWIELDLTMAQVKALFTLADTGPLPIGGVAEHLGVTLPTASHLIDRLVRAGLCERVEDATDRRRTLAQLSASGDVLVRQLRHGSREHLRPWLERLAPAELHALECGLAALRRAAAADSGPHSTVARNVDVGDGLFAHAPAARMCSTRVEGAGQS